MTKLSLIMTLIVVLVIPCAGYANYVFAPAMTYLTRDINESGATAEAQFTNLDARIGYTFDFGLYLGGLYSLAKEKNSSAGYESNDFLFGPTVGYYNWNAYALITYHIFGERDLSAGGVKYAGGNGLQVDMGYVVPVSEMVSVGPQLTYKNIDFADKQVQGLSQASEYKWNGITPYISLWLNFN